MNFKILFLLIFIFSTTSVFSAVKTWDGGGANANWNTAANWVGDVAPVANDDLVFPAASAQFMTTHNYTGTTFNSVTFEGGTYTVDGSLFSPLTTRGLTIGGGTQTINVPVNTSGAAVFNAAAGSVTTLVSLTVAAGGLTIDGDGSFGIGAIAGSGAITKNGLGASLITTTLFGYTGAINLNNGIFVADANIPNSNVTINSPTVGGGTLGFSGFGGTGTVGNVNVVQGAISAGTLQSPTGILNTRNLTFTANGNFAVKISGTTPGANGHDQLNVTGTVTLNNARLAPIPFGTFRPAIGDSFVILRNDGTDAINGTFLNAPENSVFGGALNTAFRITYQGGDGNDIVITRVNRAAFDYDSDGKADVSVFRPTNGTWYELRSGGNQFFAQQFGASDDKIVPADYDGDNRTDVAVFRPSNGSWYELRSATNTFFGVQFGESGDVPVPNDYDGDGAADTAVFRPSNGTWYEQRSLGNQFFAQQFGAAGDKPAIGDFDGDGIGDLAVYRDGNWFLFESSTSAFRAVQFGAPTDRPVAADYDGDGKTDTAVFRPSNGVWYQLNSGNNNAFSAVQFGATDDLPVAADYDGDGKNDQAVFRPSNGVWYLLRSTAGFTSVQFGQSGDVPTPNAFIP